MSTDPQDLPPGRPQHQPEAGGLSYAPVGAVRRRNYRSLIRIAVIVGVCLVALVLIEQVVDFGRSIEYCSLCGAQSTARHFEFAGLGGKYGRHIKLGTTSRFIEEQTGRPCMHNWQYMSGSSGGPIYRYRELGGWLQNGIRVARLDHCACYPELLRQRARQDSAFVGQLTAAIASKEDWVGDFWAQMADELYAIERGRPTTVPADVADP